MPNRWGGNIVPTDFAERWMGDALRIAESGGGIGSLLVDMSACSLLIKQMRRQGHPLTYSPVIISAVARALARHPQLQKLVAGNKKILGGNIDICFSIGSDEVLTPIVIITEADKKTSVEIATELREKSRQARSEATQMSHILRTWGRLVPFGFIRRFVLRTMLNQISYRRGLSGMLQVTVLPGLDNIAAQAFNTAAIVAVGGVKERPMVVDGQVAPRLSAIFSCTIDHKQWNGGQAASFLNEIQKILETEADILFPALPAQVQGASA